MPPGGPEGGRVGGPPDYVGVGALNSEMSWWHALLLQHPGVEQRAWHERELRYFDRFCTREMTDEDVASYHARFPRGADTIVGEWSPRYLHDAWSPVLLRRAAPDAKLLVMLSDPVERFRSRAPLFAADAGGRGRYASQLRALWAQFEPESVLVLQLERCRLDPFGEYARMLRFLGLRDDVRPDLRGATLFGLYLRGRRVAGRVGDAFLSGRLPGRRDLWPDAVESLVVDLEDEMGEVAAMVPELDLALWPEFAHLAAAPGAERVPAG